MTKFSFKKKQVPGKAPAGQRAKRLISIVCPVSYAQVYKPDEFMGQTAWKLNIHPDKAAKAILKEAGGQLRPKDKDVAGMEDAGIYFGVKRPVSKETSKGTIWYSGPNIYDADGAPIYTSDKEFSFESAEEVEREGEQVLIGNGSLCEVTLEVYETGQYGKFFRLESIKILELVEYVEEESSGGDLDDDIPFERAEGSAFDEDKPVTKGKAKVDW